MASRNVKIRGEEPKETPEAQVEELFDPISVGKVVEPDLVRVIPAQNFKGYCAGRWYQFYKDKPIMVPRWYEEVLRRDPTRLRG
jgi:hypothetical protein